MHACVCVCVCVCLCVSIPKLHPSNCEGLQITTTACKLPACTLQVSPGSGQGGYNQDINQNIKPGGVGLNPQPGLHPGHRPSDRSSVSSRASSSSARDMRPQSAYYDAQQAPREDHNTYGGRPKSEEVTANKLREWQEKVDPQSHGYRGNDPNHSPQYANQNPGYRAAENSAHSPPYINHNQAFPRGSEGPPGPPTFGNQSQGSRGNEAANHSPPYTNIGAITQTRPQQSQDAPRPSARDRLFGNQGGPAGSSGVGGIPKVTQNNQQRQPNFYENTQPGGQEVAPPFHQLQRPPSESEKPKPAVMPKPAVAKKPQPKVQPAEVPFKTVDNRQTQPGFYGGNARPGPQPQQGGPQQYPVGYPESRPGNQLDRQDPRAAQQDPRYAQQQDPRFGQQDPRSMQQDPRSMQQDPRNMQQDPRSMQQDPRNMQQDPRGGYSMQKFPSLRGDPGPYGYPAAQPGQPRDVPPELPPPPEENEELPPLPPPPPMPELYEQQLQEEQQRLIDSMAGRDGAEPIPPPSNLPAYDRYGHPVSGGYNGQGLEPPGVEREAESPHSRLPPPSFQPHALGQPAVAQQQSQAPNYQNINFVSEVRADSGPAGQVPAPPSTSSAPALPPPPLEHNVYEPYASRNNQHLQQQQQQQQPAPPQQTFASKPTSLYQPQQQLAPTPSQTPAQPSPLTPTGLNKNSAWDREEREKAAEQQAEELFRAREQEIAELEARSYLSMQEQDRLRKLKLEHEFQRRVREVDEKGDYEADDDDEVMERLFVSIYSSFYFFYVLLGWW